MEKVKEVEGGVAREAVAGGWEGRLRMGAIMRLGPNRVG